MLAIRMQRTGRTGHAQFRVIVQDSRFSPKSGRVVAYVGNYDPHAKTATLDGEKISQYLSTGAQPSERVAKLLQKEGIKLPDWYKAAAPKSGSVRNPDKRRSTRPDEPVAEAPAEEPATEAEAAPAETSEETPADETPNEEPESTTEPTNDTPAEEASTEDKPAETVETEAPAENAAA